MDIDTSELRAFAAHLQSASSSLDVEQVVSKGALNIKNQLVAEMRQSRHFGQISSSISYDITGGAGDVEAEIGPVKGSPGSLANIAYFGSSRGGGTVADPEGALLAEAPNLEKYLGDLAEKAI